MNTDHIARCKAEAIEKVQVLLLSLNQVDNNFEGKANEIKVLESRLAKIKEEVAANLERRDKILQDANEKALKVTRDANALLSEAERMKAEAKQEKEQAERLKGEALSLMNQAQQRQKEADSLIRQFEEKKQRILEATRL